MRLPGFHSLYNFFITRSVMSHYPRNTTLDCKAEFAQSLRILCIVILSPSLSASSSSAAHDLVHRLRKLLPEALDLKRVCRLRRRVKSLIKSTACSIYI